MRYLRRDLLAAWKRAHDVALSQPAGSTERAAADHRADQVRDLYIDVIRTPTMTEVDKADTRALLAVLEGDP